MPFRPATPIASFAVYVSSPVAINLDDFYNPLVKASRKGELIPIDGMLIRDWDPESRQVNPGERMLILYNNGVNIYFYARDGQGGTWSGNAASGTVRGETVNMLRRDTGNGYQPWTMNFNP